MKEQIKGRLRRVGRGISIMDTNSKIELSKSIKEHRTMG